MKRKNLVLATFACFAFFALAGFPALAEAPQETTFGPFVIGNQLFAGGSIEVSQLDIPGLLAIEIDGKRVAVLYREGSCTSSRCHPVLVFQCDSLGLYHLVGWKPKGTGETEALRVASVFPGLGTVAPLTAGRGNAFAGVRR